MKSQSYWGGEGSAQVASEQGQKEDRGRGEKSLPFMGEGYEICAWGESSAWCLR